MTGDACVIGDACHWGRMIVTPSGAFSGALSVVATSVSRLGFLDDTAVYSGQTRDLANGEAFSFQLMKYLVPADLVEIG